MKDLVVLFKSEYVIYGGFPIMKSNFSLIELFKKSFCTIFHLTPSILYFCATLFKLSIQFTLCFSSISFPYISFSNPEIILSLEKFCFKQSIIYLLTISTRKAPSPQEFSRTFFPYSFSIYPT